MRHQVRLRVWPVKERPRTVNAYGYTKAPGPCLPGNYRPPREGDVSTFVGPPRPDAFEFVQTFNGSAGAIAGPAIVAKGAVVDFSANFPAPGAVSYMCRAIIDAVECWAVDVFGRDVPRLLFLSGDVVATWTIVVDNRPLFLFTLPRSAEAIMPRPLFDLRSNQTFGATVALTTDTQAIVAFLGIRIRGRYVPFSISESGLK